MRKKRKKFKKHNNIFTINRKTYETPKRNDEIKHSKQAKQTDPFTFKCVRSRSPFKAHTRQREK